MTGSRDSDGGCLSVLCCLKSRGKTRPEASKSPKQAPASALPAPKVSQGSAPGPTTSSRPAVEAPALLPVESRSQPSTKIEEGDASPDQASDQASPTTRLSETTLDLWREAYDEVDDDIKKWIGNIPSVTNVKASTQELVAVVRGSEEKYKQETPKIDVGGHEILWRDYADRVVSWLTTIGDIAITFAPAPSSVAWSAVKVLLEANVAQCKDLVAILGCTDIVLSLARRGRVYEEVYLGKSLRTDAQKDLKQQLVSAYKTCLEFLAFVNVKFKQGCLRQFLRALLDPGNGERRVSDVRSLETELAVAAQACEAESSLARSNKQQKLLQSLQGPLKRIDDRVMTMLKKVEDAELRRVMQFISDIPVGAHHNEKLENRTHGTCEWLVKHPDFLEWEDSSCSSVLWLQGSIGRGKSFLSSKVIDRYRIDHEEPTHWSDQHDEGFAFFYCSRFDPARCNFKNILRSYIRQLSEVPRRSTSIHKTPYSLYQRGVKVQTELSLKDCEATLEEIINSYPRTTLVLDALDECEADTRRQIAEFFQHLIKKTSRLLKVFLASRKEVDIETYLQSFQGPQMLVQISTSDNSGDIEKFVIEEMDKYAVTWKDITPRTKQLVKETLVEKSDGMFRWTYLQWEHLKECRTNDAVRQRLHKLPKTLSGAYDEIYNHYSPEDSQRVMLQRTVRWVICALEPLDSYTLLSAIRLESKKRDGDKAFDKSDLTEHILETVCRHLVVKDSKLDVWKFPHASVAEYFGNKKETWIETAQAEVTQFMIGCLMDCCSAWPPLDLPNPDYYEDDDDYQDFPHFRVPRPNARRNYWSKGADPDNPLDPRHPLQTYIRNNWFHHVNAISDRDAKTAGVAQALKLFLGEKGPQQPSKEYRVFCEHILRIPTEWTIHDFKYYVTPADNFALGIVAFGLHQVLAGWWDKDLDHSLVNSQGQDLLAIAARFGHIDLCQGLITRGFDVNKHVEQTSQSALGEAIEEEQIETVRLLLKSGANPNRVMQDGSLLCLATRKGDDCIQALLEAGADPNIKCACDWGCALSTAAGLGNIGAVQALIQKGATINSDHSPLAAAVLTARLDCARLLIEHGANPNACLNSGEWGSPLAVAVFNGLLDCPRLLIEHGADPNAYLNSGEYGSPLAVAAFNGRVDCARLLIEHGANPNACLESGKFGSPLAAAAAGGQLECARILIEHGANVDARLGSGIYGSILSAAVVGPSPSYATVKFLMEEAKADPTQLSLDRPRNIKIDPEEDEEDKDTRQMIVAYLIHERQITAQVLIDNGVPPEDIPPDLADNAHVSSTVSEDEDL